MHILNEENLIGQGRDRACYTHTEDPKLCIKVSLRPESQSIRERNYLKYLKEKRKDLSLISCHMGEIETNHGKGHLFQLERFADGQIAPTIKEAIQRHLFSKKQLLSELQTLKNYLITNAICVRDLSPTNIVCKQGINNQIIFKIIDGIGSPNHNPLTIRWRRLTHQAIEKAWQRLERKINQIHPQL